jgi:hypothetical protein
LELREAAEALGLSPGTLHRHIRRDDLFELPPALDHQFSDAYEELRRLASAVKRSDPRATVTPTTLVNEAWVKLAKSPGFVATSKLHFKRIAARAMRQERRKR